MANSVVLVSPSHSTVLHAGVPTKVTLRLSVSMVMVYSLHLFRSLPRQFKLQNGERAKSWMSERRKLDQTLFEQIALLVFKALRGMAPMYLQDLLGFKTLGRYSPGSSQGSSHLVQHLWRPGICCCSSQVLEQPFCSYQREWLCC